MMLYHGGSAPISVPDLAHSRKAVDFGPGFYTTPIRNQAESWCRKRSRRGLAQVVSKYDFDEVVANKLKVLRFPAYTEEWLDFIVSCRGFRDKSDWDIVIGGVANDKVFDTLEAFFDGFATKEQTIGRLRMHEPNMQICFRTARALEALRFIGSDSL